MTTGCDQGEPFVDLSYCPTTVVNCGVMAVFLLRAFPNNPSPEMVP
jgi:hypothetical protein